MHRTATGTLLRISLLTWVALSATGCADASEKYGAATGGESDVKVVRIDQYQQVLELFSELEYTTQAWRAGIRTVPRVYLSEITDRWAKKTTKEIDVAQKKQLFFRAIGPLALRSNELILADRARLQSLDPVNLSQRDAAWLQQLAVRYGLTGDARPAEIKSQLLTRVDVVPPSLVLAQAAEESGWGTSRFAFKGNALFGQWTWGGDGIRPENQRAGKGDYKIAAFEAPLQSVQAHARNLNTHRAYKSFREERARLRAADERLSGLALAGTLTGYSERGEDYVKTLRSIINYNNLDAADDAYLGDNQPIVLTGLGQP